MLCCPSAWSLASETRPLKLLGQMERRLRTWSQSRWVGAEPHGAQGARVRPARMSLTRPATSSFSAEGISPVPYLTKCLALSVSFSYRCECVSVCVSMCVCKHVCVSMCVSIVCVSV